MESASELIRENSTHFCDWLVADWLYGHCSVIG
ncbi:hypothetical protein T03_4721 [Trichinella britovi]|uniref:Uncharacterized protein n=1 Tax=Trichinella britovi TaxID=45882 RepID=A0A0V0YZQ9_TRIBR|nr:hypothetical protein T03_13714 [Trichinella britovi]KRY42483.1 hypothetical protein T03_4721 [Trichinella britovi]